ncbi:hypothetical protein SDC9_169367 [bioreactor metagenome]|uniref:Uncharacterized protein n=1 Tax=bioreactor metagenome TaxID=1076179 RepID=A0A645G5Q9_9ZZZZ
MHRAHPVHAEAAGRHQSVPARPRHSPARTARAAAACAAAAAWQAGSPMNKALAPGRPQQIGSQRRRRRHHVRAAFARAFSAPRRPPGRPASRAQAAPACRFRCGALLQTCGLQNAAPAQAWCCLHGSGQSHPASPRAGRRWC